MDPFRNREASMRKGAAMERSKLREQLQLSPLFAGADTSGLTVRERSFLPGQTVKDSLNDIPCLGVVIEGLVNVFSVAPDGNSVLLNRLERGGCFGICNLMSEDPMETVLISSGNSTVVYVPKAEYLLLCKSNVSIAMKYAEVCNQRLLFLLKRISMLTTQTSRGRLLSYLILHANEEEVIFLNGSGDSLASAMNISRAALYRELRYLSDHGVMEMRKSSVRIMNRDQMMQMLYEID